METNEFVVSALIDVRSGSIVCTDGGGCEYCEGDPR